MYCCFVPYIFNRIYSCLTSQTFHRVEIHFKCCNQCLAFPEYELSSAIELWGLLAYDGTLQWKFLNHNLQTPFFLSNLFFDISWLDALCTKKKIFSENFSLTL